MRLTDRHLGKAAIHVPNQTEADFKRVDLECKQYMKLRDLENIEERIGVSLIELLKEYSKFVSEAFFMVQLSHPYMTTGKTMALTRWTFVGKVMSQLFNMLSRLVITFLPRSKEGFMAAVTICSDFGVQENKICHCFHFFPFYLP